MLRYGCGLIAGLMLVSAAQSAQAQYGMWSSFQVGMQRNTSWPRPFIQSATQTVRSPFDQMSTNGWRRQTLLGAHHFSSETGRLTEAGRLKVRWILTQAPPSRRIIFVERGFDQQTTLARVDQVQQVAASILSTGELPDVQDTHLIAEGRPADTVYNTFTRFRDTMPDPQLPEITAAGP